MIAEAGATGAARFRAHHFETAEQQFAAAKLGMWLFLVTEVLFFSGLFVAYAVFRSLHPEVFVNSAALLDTKLGAINTVILLFSSLTMAWAVRCSQLGQQRGLVLCLSLTIAAAVAFLGVKGDWVIPLWGIAAAHKTRGAMDLPGGQLVANPIPAADEIPASELAPVIAQATGEAEAQGVTGKDVTPFLLARIFELTEGKSLVANIALVRNNARLAADIAAALKA